jgi:hypothetical protein
MGIAWTSVLPDLERYTTVAGTVARKGVYGDTARFVRVFFLRGIARYEDHLWRLRKSKFYRV